LYLAALLVGLVLAAVSGLIHDLRSLTHRHLVLPHADHRTQLLTLIARRCAGGLLVFGAVGLVLASRHKVPVTATVEIAAGGAAVAVIAVTLIFRRRCQVELSISEAVAVAPIAAGGFGQVRVEHAGGEVILAAQNVDPRPIEAGAVVEVVDCSRSVVMIRRPAVG
jgi:hypothetical protein